jgi:prenyltransferase beta subunit
MKRLRNIMAGAAALVLALTLCVTAFGETRAYSDMAASIAAAEKAQMGVAQDAPLLTEEKLPAGSSVSDWTALAMARAGIADDYAGYLARLQAYVERQYAENGGLHAVKATEYHRIALTAAALGGDPAAFGAKPDGTAIDLVAEGTYNWQGEEDLGGQGLNGWIFALLTIDAVGAEVPADARYSRQDMLDAIVSAQLPDGGFSLGGGTMDMDITAMALQALAPYREQYQEVIDAALNALSAAQTVTGGFESWGAQSSESCAQVILALTALNIDPTADERFQKNQRNVVEALMDFRLSDGGFAHEKDGPLDAMACEQAMQALTAMELRQQGEGRFFDLTAAHPVQLETTPDTDTETPAESGGSFPVLPVVLIVIAVVIAMALVLVLKKKRENNV